MSTPFWNVLRVSPALVGASFLITSSVYAKEGTPEPTAIAFPQTTVELETQDTASLFQPSDIEHLGNLEKGTLITQMPEADTTTPEKTGILEQVDRYNNNEFIGEPETVDSSMEQVTNVSQLSDVSPGDWAFEALRSLVERYGCIAGYPDGTYRGNRAMTRYEFAAGLNACLQQIESLIAGLDFVTREDLETLQRLIQEFEAELATLGTRVDNLEGRVAFLEDNQFSTTTKLNGEAIFSLAGAFGDEQALQPDDLPADVDVDDEITFSDRVRIAFDTSFFGGDRLRTRFEAGNVPEFDEATGTEMARLGYEAANGNDVEVEKLHYRFPVGENLRFHIGATGVTFDDIASPNNPFFESSGSGALGRFLRRNPAIYRNGGSITAGANIQFTDFLSLDVAYLTSGDGNDPTEKNGLTDGDFTAIGQLNLGLGDNIDLAFSYGYSFYPGEDVNLSGSTSSEIAKRPFIGDFNVITGDPIFAATSANRFGFQASIRLASFLNIAGWVGYVDAEAESGLSEGAEADIWNGAVILSFLDLGKEGAVLSIGGGIPPKVTDIDNDPFGGLNIEDPDTSYIIEAQYQYPVTDNILITPGAYVILNPNHFDDNEDIYVGVIRTTFSF
jgi:BMFP domain-containing protein YqiC